MPAGLWNYDTYDANGTTAASGGIGNVYDFENHIVQKGGVTTVYDGDGDVLPSVHREAYMILRNEEECQPARP